MSLAKLISGWADAAPIEKKELKIPPVYYDVVKKDFWILNQRGDWITVNETGLRRLLKLSGFSGERAEREPLSPLDAVLLEIQRTYDVPYAGPLAGYSKGPAEVCGKTILVTESPDLILPVPGEFPVLKRYLETLFGKEQLPFARGWLKMAYESLRAGHRPPDS